MGFARVSNLFIVSEWARIVENVIMKWPIYLSEELNYPLQQITPFFDLKTTVEHSKTPIALSLSKGARGFGMFNKG